MASPQLENGYTKIANELLEAFARTNFSAYQRRVIDAIIRKTYGFQKKADYIAISQIVELTQIHKAHVSRTLRELNHRNVVTRSGNQIAINKDWQGWQELPNGVTRKKVTPSGPKVTQRGIKKLPDGADTKERKKLSKEIYSAFEKFWTIYPRKKSKGQAEKVFMRIKPDEQLLAVMLAKIKQAMKSGQWDDKQYIPYPATWLNAKGWEDEDISPKDSGLCEKCGKEQKYIGGLCAGCYFKKE